MGHTFITLSAALVIRFAGVAITKNASFETGQVSRDCGDGDFTCSIRFEGASEFVLELLGRCTEPDASCSIRFNGVDFVLVTSTRILAVLVFRESGAGYLALQQERVH